MCYICRQDVQQQGYQHFCQHFRPLGGACKNCNKCGLYDKEDEEQGSPVICYGMLMVAIQEARMRATQEYLTRHPNGIISRVGKTNGSGKSCACEHTRDVHGSST